MKISILDSTLRDGAQGEGISFTVEDKLLIAKKLDALSIDYIEGGNPFSNPKDAEFFAEAKNIAFSHSKLVAFGSTRRKNCKAHDDPGLNAIIASGAGVAAIFGKSSEMQVREILNTTNDENLEMIQSSVAFLKQQGLAVFFDAEHFFDGYKENAEYALSCIEAASAGGADAIVLCDTNGASFPDEIYKIVSEVCSVTECDVGIHCHNDNGCAAANTIMAVKAGATHVQGTYLGFGERSGNANLSTIIPDLQLKLNYSCIKEECMQKLTKTARYIADIANIIMDKSLPYVGDNAFSHKGGMHVDGVSKNSASFEQIDPASIGNRRHILLSEVSGRSAMLSMITDIDPHITKDSMETARLVEILKQKEFEGYLYESAPASLELVIRRELNQFSPFFAIKRFKVIGEQSREGQSGISSALINLRVGNETEITADEGEGPVDALDRALKKAVMSFYPQIRYLRLIDYKVRVIEPKDATAASVRVLITTTDGLKTWTTIGVSRDIIEASLAGLTDAIEYSLIKSGENCPHD